MEVDTEADGTLGEARLEVGENAVRPGLGVAAALTVGQHPGLTFAEVAVEVEVAVEDLQAASLDETVAGLCLGRLRHRAWTECQCGDDRQG